jgi:broad specificity phosphatase PhoE
MLQIFIQLNMFFCSGETDHNKGSVIQGQLDIPLSKNGMNQAKLLANSIHHLHWNEVK